MDIFAAKKKAEEMENELRTYVNLVYGPNSWTDILKLQAKIRKDRQEQIYAQQELRRNIINTIGVILGAIIGVVAFGFITYLVVLGLRV
jgi:VIT1/CCC1 family predicted Fe2+/Mn2+ transporter